jgi:hypothetical protein
MTNIVDVISGLAQAAANAFDGALDEKGEPLKIGLRREDNRGMYDRAMLDGFKVRFAANQMIVTYQSEVMLKEVHPRNKFNDEIEDKFASIAKYLKKEYKSLRKESVSLSPIGEASVTLNSTSRIRSWVEANKAYTIGGQEKETDTIRQASEEGPEKSFKKFLELSTDKKAENDKAPKNPETPEG